MSLLSFLSKMTSLLKPEFGLLPKNPTHLLHWYNFHLVWIFSRSLRCKHLTKLATLITFGRVLEYGWPGVFLGLNATWCICPTHYVWFLCIMNSLMMWLMRLVLKHWSHILHLHSFCHVQVTLWSPLDLLHSKCMASFQYDLFSRFVRFECLLKHLPQSLHG